MRPRHLRVVPLVVTGLVTFTAACGSTVARVAGAVDGLGQQPGIAGPAAADQTGLTAAAGAAGGAAVTGQPGAAQGLAGGVAGTDASGTVRHFGTVGQASGPGVTDKAIYVGAPYSANGDEVINALGLQGVSVGDQRAEYQAVIDDMNAHGGILGRKVVPVYYAADATADERTKEQAMCATYFEDHKVFAVLDGTDNSGDTIIPECTQKAKAVNIYDNISDLDGQQLRQFPYYVQPGDMRLDRAAALEAPMLGAQGYFSPWNSVTAGPGTAPAKIGILHIDTPASNRSVNRVLLPALKQAGHPVDPADVYAVAVTSDQETLAAISNAVLKFRSDGVSHVIILESGGGLCLFFLKDAASQNYYPRYGFDSYNGAQLWLGIGAVRPQDVQGAMGFGWVPLLDTATADDPDDGPYSNAARRSCIAVFHAHGIDFTDDNAKRHAINECSELELLKAALEAAGGRTINRDTFRAGLQKLEGRFVDSQSFATRLDPLHQDGAAKVRPFAYTDDCSCFRYTGGLREAG